MNNPMLGVALEEGDGLVVVRVEGEVDYATAPELWETLTAAIARDPDRFVIDLTGVTFLDLPGLDVIVKAVRARRATDHDAVVRGASARIHRVLDLTGITPALTLESA